MIFGRIAGMGITGGRIKPILFFYWGEHTSTFLIPSPHYTDSIKHLLTQWELKRVYSLHPCYSLTVPEFLSFHRIKKEHASATHEYTSMGSSMP